MKKAIFILVLFTAALGLRAQEAAEGMRKGTISFRMNNMEYSAPVTSIIIRKENNLLISVYSEMVKEGNADRASMSFAVSELRKGAGIIEGYSAFDYQSVKKGQTDRNGNPRSFHFSAQGNKGRLSTQYTNFEYPNSTTSIFIDEVMIENGKLRIKGRFEGMFISPEEQPMSVTRCELKDGRFEIIL